MRVTIDSKEVEIFGEDKNIVDVADRAKIGIPAPCYKDGRKKGCCKACVIEINGKKEYACVTKPIDGMEIVFSRADLAQIRKERLLAYRDSQLRSTKGCECSCSGNNCGSGKTKCC